jgi:hypothetical protein
MDAIRRLVVFLRVPRFAIIPGHLNSDVTFYEPAFTGLQRRGVVAGEMLLALGGLQELLELLSADAFLGVCAPFDAGCADRPGVQMAALPAGGFGLVAPNLDLFAALLAPDIFRFWRSYLNASWTTFLKHDLPYPLRAK